MNYFATGFKAGIEFFGLLAGILSPFILFVGLCLAVAWWIEYFSKKSSDIK